MPTGFSSFRHFVLDSVCAKVYVPILTDIVKPYASAFAFEVNQFAARPGMQTVDLIQMCRICIELASYWQDAIRLLTPCGMVPSLMPCAWSEFP